MKGNKYFNKITIITEHSQYFFILSYFIILSYFPFFPPSLPPLPPPPPPFLSSLGLGLSPPFPPENIKLWGLEILMTIYWGTFSFLWSLGWHRGNYCQAWPSRCLASSLDSAKIPLISALQQTRERESVFYKIANITIYERKYRYVAVISLNIL